MSLPVFDKSVLEGVNPRGRVDVLASNVLERVAAGHGLTPQFQALKPVLDFGLLYFLGPKKEFSRAVRGLSAPQRVKRPRRITAGVKRSPSLARSRRVKTPEILDAEIVSL